MILNFNEIKKEDVAKAGGKGANLGEMTLANLNVPKGFVIAADTYIDFLKYNGLEKIFKEKLEKANNDEKTLLAIASDFRALIKKAGFSNQIINQIEKRYQSLGENIRVAVRSSATAEDLIDASFAGQQETYLNVLGIDNIIEKIIMCYVSLWKDRAVSYRFNQGYDQSTVAIAIVIQEMIESEKSGVLFTTNPISKNDNETLINASYGLGESVVSGRVSADSYVLNKDGKILETNIGNKEIKIIYGEKETIEVEVPKEERNKLVLNKNDLSSILKVGLAIEKHYGMPMDIEWAIKGNELYILQARAITTLKDNNEESIIKEYIKNTKPKGNMRKTIAFQLEKMPFAYRVLDFDYMIIINQQKAVIFNEIGLEINSNPGIDFDGIQTLPKSKLGINKNILNVFKLLKVIKDFQYCESKCKEFMPKYQSKMEEIKNINFENMTLIDCKNFMELSAKYLRKLSYDRFKYALFPTVYAFNKYTKILKKISKEYTAFDLYWGLDNKTNMVTKDLYKIAEKIKYNKELKEDILKGKDYNLLCDKYIEFKDMTDEFLKNNGYKSDFNCYCLEAKTFIEEPNRILNIIKPILLSNQIVNFDEKEKDFKQLMEALKNIYGNKYEKLERNIKSFRYLHIVREESQYLWECLFYHVRKCVIQINKILLNNEDYNSGIANLFYDELIDAMERGYLCQEDLENIKRRNEKFPLATKVWEASKTLVFDGNSDVLKGVSGSGGVVVGNVCVINSPKEFYKMKKGDILVCHLTDPEWTPLFKLANGVVADTGSALSHAAIVAREYHIPAVLGVGYASTRFKDGDKIKVDGDKGIVRSA